MSSTTTDRPRRMVFKMDNSDALASSSISSVDDRKLRGLLNKITRNPDSFTSISGLILALINESEGNVQRLQRVVQLVYEHGIDDVAFSGLFAHLCQTIMEQISPNFVVDFKSDGPLAGGQLFRKYLLDHCQVQFNYLWSPQQTAVVLRSEDPQTWSQKLFSDEYYAAEKVKRQRRGLVRFVGELYKLDVLEDKVVHDCITRFLRDNPPEEQEIDSLCLLLSEVGQTLDTKAPLYATAYFERMGEIAKMSQVSFRAKSLLTDVIELRERNWVFRSVPTADGLPLPPLPPQGGVARLRGRQA